MSTLDGPLVMLILTVAHIGPKVICSPTTFKVWDSGYARGFPLTLNSG